VSDSPLSRERAGCGSNAAPYVLGALTEQEHRDFAGHLESCVVCREEVADLQVVADALPAAAPQLEAPSPLRAKVLASVRAEPDGEPSAQSKERARGSRVPLSAQGRRRGGFMLQKLPAFAGAAVAVALALAVVALVSGTGTGSGSTRVIPAQVSASGASASVRLSGGQAVLQVNGMPQAGAGQVYEVWVDRGGATEPTDALFTVTRAGRAEVDVPGAIAGVRRVLVTSEPLGGSSVPTTRPVIVANLG
jgi:Anti-sigma-K factor rskA